MGSTRPDSNNIGATTNTVIIPTCAWFFVKVAAAKPMPAVVKTNRAVRLKNYGMLPLIGTPNTGRMMPNNATAVAQRMTRVIARTLGNMI